MSRELLNRCYYGRSCREHPTEPATTKSERHQWEAMMDQREEEYKALAR